MTKTKSKRLLSLLLSLALVFTMVSPALAADTIIGEVSETMATVAADGDDDTTYSDARAEYRAEQGVEVVQNFEGTTSLGLGGDLTTSTAYISDGYLDSKSAQVSVGTTKTKGNLWMFLGTTTLQGDGIYFEVQSTEQIFIANKGAGQIVLYDGTTTSATQITDSVLTANQYFTVETISSESGNYIYGITVSWSVFYNNKEDYSLLYSGYTASNGGFALKIYGNETWLGTTAIDNIGFYGVYDNVAYNTTTGTAYESLQDAIDAASSGETIKLVSDVALDAQLTVSNTVTLDLNGYTVTASDGISLSADLTVNDSSTDGTGVITNASTSNDLITVNADDVTVTINGGTLQAGCDGIFAYNLSNVSVVMNGGTINTADGTSGNDGIHFMYGSNNSVTVNGGAINALNIAVEFNAETSPTATVNGGYFKQDSTSYGLVRGAVLTIPDNYEWKAAEGDYAGYYTVAEYTGDTVATVNGTGYATLRAAFAAAADGDTITIVKDFTVAEVVGLGYQCGAEVSGNKSVTLDLNGYTITVDENAGGNSFALIYVHSGSSLTLVDNSEAGTGAIDIQTTSTYAIRNCGTFTMNSGTITSVGYGIESKPYYYYCYSDAQTAAYVSTTTIINGGTITGGTQVLRVDNATDYTATLTIEDVTLTGGIYLSGTNVTGVTATINGGTFTASSTSNSVIEINNGTSLTINGGTFNAATSSYSSTDLITIRSNGGTLTITDGTFNAADAVVYVSNFSSSKTFTVNLNGGTYTSTTNTDIVYVSSSSSTTTTVTVTSGTYSADVSDYVDTDTYTVTYNSEGNYVVGGDSSSAVAQNTTTGVCYETLQAAIDAASSGDTIQLLSDVTEDITIANGQTIILDLNGKKITNSSTHTIVNYGTLTITDSSEENSGTVDNVTHAKAALVNYGTATLLGGTYKRSAEAGSSSSNNGGNSYYTIMNYNQMTVGTEGEECSVVIENNGCYSSCVANGYPTTNDKTSAQTITDEVTPTLTIYGGTISGGINTIRNCYDGVLNIYGGTFKNNSDTSTLCTVIKNHNIANIYDGTFTATGNAYVIYNQSSNSELGQAIMNIEDGTFTSESFVVAILSTAETASVTIKDGTFTSTSTNVFGKSSTAVDDVAVSGGSFSSKVPYAYCAYGYNPTTTVGEDGMYTVEKFYLNASGDTTESTTQTPATIASINSSTETMYVKVLGSYLGTADGAVYTIENYPTTSLTFTETTTDDDGNETTVTHTYIFAGWYSYDSTNGYTAYGTSMWESIDEDAYYYAKFVDANVLKVGFQYAYYQSGTTTQASESDTTIYLRIISSVDSLDYEETGFNVVFTSTDSENPTTYTYTGLKVSKVYEHIYGQSTYLPTEFSDASTYFSTYVIEQVPTTGYTVVAYAYWKTLDGTTVVSQATSTISGLSMVGSTTDDLLEISEIISAASSTATASDEG